MKHFKMFLAGLLGFALSLAAPLAGAQSASDTLENNIITHQFRTGSWAKPTVLAIALGTACSAASFTEIATTGGYARVSANPADATWAATNGTNGQTSNVGALTFATASAGDGA